MQPRILPILLALSLVTMAPLAMATHVEERTETVAYIGGEGTLDFCSIGLDVASACFNVEDGEEGLTVEIDDDSDLIVSGWITVLDGNGDIVDDAGGAFCGGETTIDLPQAASDIIVVVNGPHWSAIDCPGEGFGTTGTVTATFLTPIEHA